MAISDDDIWIGSYGVFTALSVRDARVVAAVGQLTPGDALLASDGTTTWELAGDGLRELAPRS